MAILGRDLTTIRVGGSIDRFEQPSTEPDLIRILQDNPGRCKAIGGGSNLILADSGFRGTLIRPEFNEINECELSPYTSLVETWRHIVNPSGRYHGNELYENLPEQTGEEVLLSVGSNVPWAKFVHYCLSHHISGLEKYARIPCRVGGAIRNNIHAGNELVSRYVIAVHSVDRQGAPHLHDQSGLGFSYDCSRFVEQPEVITSVLFLLRRVSNEQSDIDAELYRTILQRKSQSQPSGPNCGSVFQNLPAFEDRPVATAWYIEQSGGKGLRYGGMEVSPLHANFIVNLGDGTQADFLVLAHTVMRRVWEKYGIRLIPEVEVVDEKGASAWE